MAARSSWNERPQDLTQTPQPSAPVFGFLSVEVSGLDEQYPGLREFMAARTTALSRTAYLLTGDHYLAEDLVQSAFVRILRHWNRVRDDQPEAYVRRTMYHLYLSWYRRRRPPERLTSRVPEAAGVDPYQGSVLRLTLDAALARLSSRQRTVLVLRYYEDLSEVEVAAVLGRSVGSVKRHAHDGLARLRQLAPYLVEELPATKEVSR